MARLRRISGGGALALVINLVLALGVLGIAFGAPGRGDRPELELASADGSLSITNSKDGDAVFVATGMRPGVVAAGTVQIANTGSRAGALALARDGAPAESAGAGGGLLSSRVVLRVLDVTDGTVQELWSGKLAAMPRLGVGALAAGEERAYRFEAVMPSAADDNAFQGAQMSVGFTWAAIANGDPAATPTPTPPSTPVAGTPGLPATPAVTPVTSAGETPTGAALGAKLFALPSARKCVRGGRLAFKIRRPQGAGFAAITVKVNRKTKLKLTGAKARKVKPSVKLRRLSAGTLNFTIAATLTDGRKATAQRVYKTCTRKR